MFCCPMVSHLLKLQIEFFFAFQEMIWFVHVDAKSEVEAALSKPSLGLLEESRGLLFERWDRCSCTILLRVCVCVCVWWEIGRPGGIGGLGVCRREAYHRSPNPALDSRLCYVTIRHYVMRSRITQDWTFRFQKAGSRCRRKTCHFTLFNSSNTVTMFACMLPL